MKKKKKKVMMMIKIMMIKLEIYIQQLSKH
jgi:hypothetical protein